MTGIRPKCLSCHEPMRTLVIPGQPARAETLRTDSVPKSLPVKIGYACLSCREIALTLDMLQADTYVLVFAKRAAKRAPRIDKKDREVLDSIETETKRLTRSRKVKP